MSWRTPNQTHAVCGIRKKKHDVASGINNKKIVNYEKLAKANSNSVIIYVMYYSACTALLCKIKLFILGTVWVFFSVCVSVLCNRASCCVCRLFLKHSRLTYLPPFHLWQTAPRSGRLAESGDAGLQMAALAWLVSEISPHQKRAISFPPPKKLALFWRALVLLGDGLSADRSSG